MDTSFVNEKDIIIYEEDLILEVTILYNKLGNNKTDIKTIIHSVKDLQKEVLHESAKKIRI